MEQIKHLAQTYAVFSIVVIVVTTPCWWPWLGRKLWLLSWTVHSILTGYTVRSEIRRVKMNARMIRYVPRILFQRLKVQLFHYEYDTDTTVWGAIPDHVERTIVSSAMRLRGPFYYKRGGKRYWRKDIIVASSRHWDHLAGWGYLMFIMNFKAGLIQTTNMQWKRGTQPSADQGFFDQYGVYWTRKAAMKQIIKTGQAEHLRGCQPIGRYDELYSEMLQ